jgi:anaerobic ribonucleoside-triphosphate reductase activating protein
MDIRVNLIYHPLYVLGSGERVGLWFQGCSLGCKGCISQHTWSKGAGELYEVEELVSRLLSYGSTRITITGGEPFEQSLALKSLLISLRKGGVDDILLYSGFEYGYLKERFGDILELIDALVVGRFEIDRPTKFVYKGSANQEMVILNQELKESYMQYRQETKRRLQVTKGREIFVLGIPDIRDEILV